MQSTEYYISCIMCMHNMGIMGSICLKHHSLVHMHRTLMGLEQAVQCLQETEKGLIKLGLCAVLRSVAAVMQHASPISKLHVRPLYWHVTSIAESLSNVTRLYCLAF